MRRILLLLLASGCHGQPVQDGIVNDAEVEVATDVAPTDAAVDTRAPDAKPTCPGWFCAAFDDVKVPEEGWTQKIVAGTGSLVLDGLARSSPNAALFGFEKDLSKASHAQLEKRLRLSETAVRAELSLRVDVAPTERVPIVTLARGGGYGVVIGWDTTGILQLERLILGSDAKVVPFSKGIPDKTWSHLAIEVQFVTTSLGTVRVLLDGEVVAEANGGQTTDAPAADTSLLIGPGVSGSFASFRMWVDDVVLRAP